MEPLIKLISSVPKFNEYIEDVTKNKVNVALTSLTDTAKVHFSYATKEIVKKPICIITYNEMQAKKLLKDFKYFSNNVAIFPKREIVTYDFDAESIEYLHERISVLNKIFRKNVDVLITTIESASQKMITKTSLYSNIIKINVGDTLVLEDIKNKLSMLGYKRCELIEGKGGFSVRGGIIDISIPHIDKGIRIELWGDTVDSIRYFDIITQRTTEMKQEITIYPAHEFLLEDSVKEISAKIEDMQDKEKIENGDYINKVDKYFEKFYKTSETILDYLENDYLVFLDENDKIKQRIESIKKENENIADNLIEKGKTIPESLLNQLDYNEFINKIQKVQTICLEKQDFSKNIHAKRKEYSFSCREVNFFRSGMDLLFKEIKEKKNQIIVIYCGTEENAKKLSEALNREEIRQQQNIWTNPTEK